jgi:penicillin-binding protein 1C
MRLSKYWIRFSLVAILLPVFSFAVFNQLSPLATFIELDQAVVITSSEGEVLRSFADDKGIHRYPITLEQVTPFYLQTLLAYEDKYFYSHPGFNPFSYARALMQWVVNGRVISGGSTITMQVARIIDPHRRTLRGKLKQLFRAIQLEVHYSKQEILTLYLNRAPFGSNIEGVEAAAQFYLQKSAIDVNRAEAVLLVIMPQRPTRYRPDLHPEQAKLARNKVLSRIEQMNLITTEEAVQLSHHPVSATRHQRNNIASLYARNIRNTQSQKSVTRTYINYELQLTLKQLFISLKGRLPEKASAAAIIVDNTTHQIIAYQGSIDFSDKKRFSHVDMALATRSPGSTLKPFIYGMAMDQRLIHSQSLLSDIPTSFNGYKPANLNGRYSGAVTVKSALQQSLNVPAIQVLNSLTPDFFDRQLKSANIHLKHESANLAMGLGGTGSNLKQLVQLYSSLASDGVVFNLLEHEGSPIALGKPLLSPEASWIIFDLLNSHSPPDRAVANYRRKIGWKTGTSYGYRDSWSVGVSPDYTIGVWVGRPDGTPIVGMLGATLAAPVMFDLFDLLPNDRSELEQPSSVIEQTICWPGGVSIELTPEHDCQTVKTGALTLLGYAPPTLQTNGQLVIDHQMPIELSHWLMQRRESQSDNNKENVKILTPNNGQHFFSEQVDRIMIKANKQQGVEWYVNQRLFTDRWLKLGDYMGEIDISACRQQHCDAIQIFSH